MSRGKTSNESYFEARRRRVLKAAPGEAVLVPAATEVTQSRDLCHPFRQDSDFYYLTGINEPGAALLLRATAKGARSVLYLRDRDSAKERWEGERIGLARAKRRFNVDEVKDIEDFPLEFPAQVKDIETLHIPLGVNSEIDELVLECFKTKIGPQRHFPNTLKDARVILSELRFVKDAYELKCLKHAIEITATALTSLAPHLRSSSSEAHAARMLESEFARRGSPRIAFPTIVASGKNATCLHHTPASNPLWRRELVMIDSGATYRGYSADVTRMFPVSGVFSEPQAAVYDVVHRALKTGRRQSKPGASLRSIHRAVVNELCRGLIELGVCRGSLEQLVKSERYRAYYPHSTGHWLGLDTHDISPLHYKRNGSKTEAARRPLVPGNVFTVEPGLYFDPRDKAIPKEFRGIGIRLEDDMVITKQGATNLTQQIPLERNDIEAMML